MLEIKKNEFIAFMLESNVLKFGDFTAKSGRKTPYFVNTGFYRTGGQISKLGGFYAQLIKETTGGAFDVMFGPAYKGIPLVVTAASALYQQYQMDKPYCFNRKEVKDHGEGGNMVGCTPRDGERVIIVEDVVTAGTAVRESVPVLQACGKVEIPHMFISVDRCEVGQIPGKTAIMQIQEEFGIQVHAIVTVTDIYAYLKAHGEDPNVLKQMEAYMEQYCVLN